MASLNKISLIGYLGQDPLFRAFQNGDQVATLSLATSEPWKDKNTGELKSKTQWHKIVVKNQHFISLIQKHVKKGSCLFVEGKLEYRQYENEGKTESITEIIVSLYDSKIQILDKIQKNDQSFGELSPKMNPNQKAYKNSEQIASQSFDFYDDIPF